MPPKLKKLRLPALALCCAVVLVCAGILLQRELCSRREAEKNLMLRQEMYSALASLTPLQDKKPVLEARESAGDGPRYARVLPQYQELWKENRDMWGWLSIPDTPIDYPVMYTPEDPEFYLRRAFDKSYLYSGCLFVGEGCLPTGSHVILYGHNMEDGTMFSTLPLYADPEYAAAHPTIKFDTIVQEGTFQVIAAFYSQAYREEGEDAFRYHLYTSLDDPEIFEEYIEKAKENSLYDTGVTAEYGQRVITLSTCSYHIKDGRFAVVAVETAASKAAGEPALP